MFGLHRSVLSSRFSYVNIARLTVSRTDAELMLYVRVTEGKPRQRFVFFPLRSDFFFATFGFEFLGFMIAFHLFGCCSLLASNGQAWYLIGSLRQPVQRIDKDPNIWISGQDWSCLELPRRPFTFYPTRILIGWIYRNTISLKTTKRYAQQRSTAPASFSGSFLRSLTIHH